MSRTTVLVFTAFVILCLVVAVAQEDQKDVVHPVKEMVDAILSDATLHDRSFYYDPGFKAIGSFAIHNHFAKRVCMGYLVSDGTHLSYRFIRAFPGLGSSNDAFRTELSNVRRVEAKFYRSSRGFMDYYPERLSVKIFFDKPIRGLAGDWKKEDIKFDIWDVAFGETLMSSFRELEVDVREKN